MCTINMLLFNACHKESPNKLVKINIMFTSSGLGDMSFNDNLYKGIIEARTLYDFEVEYAFPEELSEATQIFSIWIDSISEYKELIIVLGQEYKSMINSFQGQFNEKEILLIDAEADYYKNITSIEFSIYGASYQAGVASHYFCLNDTAGVIGGMPITPVINGVDGFVHGFNKLEPSFTEVQYLGDNYEAFNDFNKAASTSNEMFNHCQVIYGIAGYANLGIFETLRKSKDCFAIGVDQDQSWLCKDKILGSVVKQIDIVAIEYIGEFIDGDLKPGHTLVGLESNYIEFKLNKYFEDELGSIVNNCIQEAIEAEKQYLYKLVKK